MPKTKLTTTTICLIQGNVNNVEWLMGCVNNFGMKYGVSKRRNGCAFQDGARIIYFNWSSRHFLYLTRHGLYSLFLLPFGMRSVTIFCHMKYLNAPHRTVHALFAHTALRKRVPYATVNVYVR